MGKYPHLAYRTHRKYPHLAYNPLRGLNIRKVSARIIEALEKQALPITSGLLGLIPKMVGRTGTIIQLDPFQGALVTLDLQVPDQPKEVWVPVKGLESLKEPTERSPWRVVGGTCYEDAWRFTIKQDEGWLVHGSVQPIDKRINHAWWEGITGYIWDPEYKFMSAAQYVSKFSPQEQNRYNPEQAAIMAAWTKNYGPWTEAEQKQFLKPSYLKGGDVHIVSGFKIPTTRVSSLGFVELELPVARAVEALVDENPWSSGFHAALNQRWTIVFRGKISGRAVKAARAAGLEVSYRELLEGSGQFLTDVSLPSVGVTEIEKATEVFNKFAELYEGKAGSSPRYLKEPFFQPYTVREASYLTSSLPIIHEATSENPDPTQFLPVEVPSAFPEGDPSTFSTQEKAQIDRFINQVPDKNDTMAINYWLDWGDRKVYLEGWIDKCLAGTGFPPMEGGEWDIKIRYMVDDTHRTLREKEKERGLTLIEGGFREFDAGSKEWLYGVSWGVYETKHNPGKQVRITSTGTTLSWDDWQKELERYQHWGITLPEIEILGEEKPEVSTLKQPDAIKVSKANGFVTISMTPDTVARELLRQHKETGVASGSVERLAREAAIHRYPSLAKLAPYQFILKIEPPEGKSGWGWETNWDIMQNWTSMYPRPEIEGHYFSFSPSYADLPPTLGIHGVI